MKNKKFLFAAIAFAAVAAIVLLFNDRRQKDNQPTAASEAQTGTKPKEPPVKINPKRPQPAATIPDMAERAAKDGKEITPLETEPFGDHVGDVESRPIEAQELVVDWEAAAEHPPLVTAQL